jgi:hypothetical protein
MFLAVGHGHAVFEHRGWPWSRGGQVPSRVIVFLGKRVTIFPGKTKMLVSAYPISGPMVSVQVEDCHGPPGWEQWADAES